MRALGGYDNQI